ncbi:class I SAM-dependent methyltransferase [Luedemannella helvata]|uniref:Class I SAM-dependent methyltransferase n=1 Tax=Luedemannella helvata TaxID=349315 RepID=A0ABN2KD90_9ACTN
MADARTAAARGAVSFDPIAERYDETRGGEARGAVRANDVAAWLPAGRVVEVGVGTGLVAAALRHRGVDVFGVDLSPHMAARAVDRIGPRVALGDAHALPLADACADAVLFVWVLHLVGGVGPAFAEAARVLRPGGRVIAVHDAPRSTPTDLDGPVDALFAPLREARPDSQETVAAAAHEAGLITLHQGDTSRHQTAKSPRATTAEIETRTWAYLWHLDDAQWQATVEPVLAQLRALPDQERPRGYEQWSSLSVFARP